MIEKHVGDFEYINQWIDALPNSNELDNNIAFKILRFIASRNKEFAPVLSVADMTGFLYPQLQPFFERRDIGILQTIDFLHAQNLLISHFFKKAYFCSHCDCAFLNFEEICPHCSSNDLNMDELIHHFKCAYTGASPDFKRGDDLVCPKCDKALRHIGVDYDKPSTVYRCNQCAHSFQEPLVTSTCYNCGRTTEPENQVLRTIQSYSISSIGENAARYGMESLFANILETEIKLTPFASFNDFYNVEVARIQRYKKSTSSLVLFGFENLNELYIQLGKRAQNIFVELSAVFKSVLRSSDLITARNESVFIVIMTETDVVSAERAVERLKEGVEALFENNLDYKPTLFTRIHEVGPELSPEKMLEQFL
jgi:GGDEF domain-containing protein